MDHPGLMSSLQGLGDLLRYWQGLVQWDLALGNPVGEGRAFDQLQDECAAALDFVVFNAVDGGDVRVVEAGEDVRFPLEPGEPIGVRCEGVGEDLQGDIAAQLRIGGAIDLSHAPLADKGGDVVVPETGADGQGHELCW